MKIFDSLTHIKSDAQWYGSHHNASAERLLKEFENGTSKALLVGMPDDDIHYLISIAKMHSDKFIPIAPIIFDDSTAFHQLEEQIIYLQQMGFKGIKIHPRLLNINLTHPKIIEIIHLSGKYNLVSLLCTVHRSPSKPLKRPLSDIIHEICDETQNSKTILLHGGYYDLLATSELIRSYENVLMDLSATLIRFKDTSVIQDISFLFKTFDRRICIGSDFPEYTMSDIMQVIEEKKLNDIDSNKLENILYNNLYNYFQGTT